MRVCIICCYVYVVFVWVVLVVFLLGCLGDYVKFSYFKLSFELVVVIQFFVLKFQVQFNELMESMYYVVGMSYVVEGDIMKVVVDCCFIFG